ncbi:hypothetical protein JYU34_008585 [Plutella xylostella]|uniref:Uncharacterized protein n=1 Tax=Plutella xylostella TaxID=51655 RepID=A0ABQ7QL99_PLUXY|nr:hypothetical protein JYU34_008585 [Plutella xylostella]
MLIVLHSGPATLHAPPPLGLAAPHNTQKKQRFFAPSERIRKKGGDSATSPRANEVTRATLADQSARGAGAGARTVPRPRFAPAFYLLLRDLARTTGV